jgi:hypothetical protein
VSDQVLPRMSVRVLRGVTSCVASQIVPRLTVQALLPAQVRTADD